MILRCWSHYMSIVLIAIIIKIRRKSMLVHCGESDLTVIAGIASW